MNEMAGSSSSQSQAPKILLAKPPGLATAGPAVAAAAAQFGREDETAPHHHHRSRLPSITSVNLLSDSWDFHNDRFLPFLTENTDFTVVGIIGPPGVGKSTILNELYGFDGTSPGMLPPFTVQSEDNRAMARHCTVGIEPRISAERLILLDTQPVFSPSVLAEMMRPDGSSTISVLSGENLSTELAHELTAIQLGVLLASICHVLLVVSDGVYDDSMRHLMLTVDLLKHGIPDPSSLNSAYLQSSNVGPEKENKDKVSEAEEYMATPLFVHTKLQDENFTPSPLIDQSSIIKDKADSPKAQYKSYISALCKLRNQVLSMNGLSFARTVSEREWLKNSAKIWELVKSSAIIAEYGQALQSSGMFRR
uniref:Protein SMG9 n=1 Tax=Salix viminalis TaxID=40686 RepID=A0A6N2KQX4_SALVM